ncbi:MAG TPA: CpaF family protein [Aggregatilineales bacterium]|nr:CpaF family protein [Aggregatilineales bacterium]
MGSFLSRRTGQPDNSPKPEFTRPPAGPLQAGTVPPGGVEQAAKNEGDAYEPPPKRRTTPRIAELRKQLRSKLLSAPEEADNWSRDNPEHQKIISDRLQIYLQRANIPVTRPEFDELRECILNDLLGFGAIDPLVRDRSYSEIMVNGPEIIFGERRGKLVETEYVFDDNDHVMWVAQRIVRRIGRSFNRENPMTDARLPDGSRVHLIMPPSALQGTTITIRKFPEKALTSQDLIRFGSFTPEVAEFLEACVGARLNIVVSGGTGSGKTTLLNVLSAYIPEDERIVTIEDSAELQLSQRHVVRLETAPPVPGAPPAIPGESRQGQLVIRDLVKGALRMRPDRIVVGECRSGEALDMLQAMNTGHDGSLTTVHANSPRDCVARLETLTLMAGMDLPIGVIRRQIASAVQVIVQQSRLKDGSRKIVQVSELQGMEGEQVTIQDIFVYKTPDHKGQGPSHNGGGTLAPTGFRPKFMERLEQAGFKLNAKIFGAGQQKAE